MTTAHNETFSKLILCFAGGGRPGVVTEAGGLFGKPLKKSWLTPVSDFGFPDRPKRLKEFFVLTREELTLRVFADGDVYEYKIPGGRTVSGKKLGLTATLAGFEFVSETANPYISKPMLTVEVV
jgi:hypothetical protein